MKWLRLICLAAVAGQLMASGAAADPAAATPKGAPDTPNGPPVLRPSEPPDSIHLTLPGAPPVTPALKKIRAVPPVALPAPSPRNLVQNAALREPPPLPVIAPLPVVTPLPAVAPLKPPPPLEIASEVAAYCKKQIGHWKETDAAKLLGEPHRHRPAYDENMTVNGTIYAFPDPTNKYKELELDFDLHSGTLRTVFVYPPRLTWDECRRLWHGPVAAADAAPGRKGNRARG